MNSYLYYHQLALLTGQTKLVPCQASTDAARYFTVISKLNEQAHIYGCVYIATKEALDSLIKDESIR